MQSLLAPASRAAMSLGLAALLTGPAAASDSLRFTFPRAEFLPDAEGMRLAQDFVANSLPPGLPMTEAIARVERAVMSCHGGRLQDGVVSCDYFIGTPRNEGDQGEDFWTLSLRPGPDGRLQSASLRRYHVGLPGLFNR